MTFLTAISFTTKCVNLFLEEALLLNPVNIPETYVCIYSSTIIWHARIVSVCPSVRPYNRNRSKTGIAVKAAAAAVAAHPGAAAAAATVYLTSDGLELRRRRRSW